MTITDVDDLVGNASIHLECESISINFQEDSNLKNGNDEVVTYFFERFP